MVSMALNLSGKFYVNYLHNGSIKKSEIRTIYKKLIGINVGGRH